jgi:hypothetical protein
MDPAAAKQQIAERVKQASNFLVTVNANPTVDQLAACIGFRAKSLTSWNF